MVVWASFTAIPSIGVGYSYLVAQVVSWALIACGWWSIIPLLQGANARGRLRGALRVFGSASVVFALGRVGEIHDVLAVHLVVYGWMVTFVGLCIAAVGFFKTSYTRSGPGDYLIDAQEQPETVEEVLPREGRSTFRTPRAIILTGCALLAISWGLLGWLSQHGMNYNREKGVVMYYTAAVVGWGMLGWAWWSAIGKLAMFSTANRRVRPAFRCFAIASGVMAVGNLALLLQVLAGVPGVNGFALETSTSIAVVGLAFVAIGFWNAGEMLGARKGPNPPERGVGNEEELEVIEISG
ncbi:MAG: hypothetical protein M1134_01940 [Actinobacteria bacterium]|nr:hypothetical protein [Actinomycetota bacterium]